IRLGVVLLALAVALVTPAARALSAAEPTREEALAALADTRNVDNRRHGAMALAKTGVMADVPKLAAALRDDDPLGRNPPERSMWEVWSRSGDAAVDRLLASGIEQMSAARASWPCRRSPRSSGAGRILRRAGTSGPRCTTSWVSTRSRSPTATRS